MSARRKEMHQLQELVRYHRMGCGPREVARLLGLSPMTERRYRSALTAAGLLAGSAEELPELKQLQEAVKAIFPPGCLRQPSTVEEYRPEIEGMLKKEARPKAIYDCLRLKHAEFSGSLSAVKRLCRRLRQDRGPRASEVAIPVLTEPGQIAQVDFGYLGGIYDPASGRVRKCWVFVMVLGFSRHLYADLVFDQKVETWLDLHLRAFEYFGGVPAVVVPDNLKAAVIRAAFTPEQECELQRSYRELARHYGFRIDPAPPYQPRKKGKVEAGVKYVKNNFGQPRSFRDLAEARSQLREWLREVAGQRVHGTTGEKPAEAFAAREARHLLPLPARRYETVVWKQAKVHQDSHVVFDKRLYSVPWPQIGQQVWLRATTSSVEVYQAEERIATHSRQGTSPRSTVESHLPDYRVSWRERGRAFWEERASALGPEVLAYIQAVFEKDQELSQLRVVQAMVSHLEGFPVERARAAAARAHYYGNYSYQGLKRILRQGLDLQPLLPVDSQRRGVLEAPRFARGSAEISRRVKEARHGNN